MKSQFLPALIAALGSVAFAQPSQAASPAILTPSSVLSCKVYSGQVPSPYDVILQIVQYTNGEIKAGAEEQLFHEVNWTPTLLKNLGPVKYQKKGDTDFYGFKTTRIAPAQSQGVCEGPGRDTVWCDITLPTTEKTEHTYFLEIDTRMPLAARVTVKSKVSRYGGISILNPQDNSIEKHPSVVTADCQTM